MKTIVRLASLVLVLAAFGCCSTVRTAPHSADLSTVINQIKGDLNFFFSSPVPEVSSKTKCETDPNPLDVTKVKLTLKAVVGAESGSTAGLESPLQILSIDPTYSGSYSDSRTQSLELSFNVETLPSLTEARAVSEHPLADALIGVRKQLLAVEHDLKPCLSSKDGGKLTLSFDIVRKSTGGIALKVLGIKLGDKLTASNEAHQTLEVTFAVKGQMLALQ
jgi:hypothetical protein